MKSLEVGDKELVYLILALRHYEAKLMADWGSENEDLAADAVNDLVFVQSRLKRAKQANGEA
ncbi:MAG: hypothetical protein RL748_3493 [Pseudomonadota bacterium]|jgi:hypothetical protein